MASKKDISIVIVNYNVKDFLLQCLRSIDQSVKGLDVEVIVVDNNSTDGSVKFLQPLFPDVNFIALKENIGFGRANNLGIEKALGEYVLILNPDTIIEDDTLERMKEYMDNNSSVGIAGCKVLNPDGTFQLACRRGFPTPWASFTKLFGLQKLFPGSKLFSKYNQTFRSIDETYYIDAVIGAFMFCRKEILDDLNGFDPDFFMYGEDIDLCYRASKKGWKIAYVHNTSIIHFKGESTKRSTINDVKHFYGAMEIYVRKHYSRSFFFLILLRMAILLRSFMAYANKYKRDLFVITFDLISINATLLLATKLRKGEFFNFPDYAYPTVFIALSLVLVVTMTAVGDYFEGRQSAKKSFIALMMSFFILSSMTYFFNQFAFSRGILLMTIGFTTVLAVGSRWGLSLFDKIAGRDSDRRVAIVGMNKHTENIVNSLRTAESRNADIIGVINIRQDYEMMENNLPYLGSIEYLPRIIEQNRIQEVIITDKEVSQNQLVKMIASTSNPSVRFHVVNEYEDLLTSKILDEISGVQAGIPKYNITRLRFRIIKRTTDITISLLLLTIGLPFLFLAVSEKKLYIRKLFKVLSGKYSFIGLYPIEGEEQPVGKTGIIGLAHISRPGTLSKQAIRNLNDFYIQHVNMSLETDIFLKFLFRRKHGN